MKLKLSQSTRVMVTLVSILVTVLLVNALLSGIYNFMNVGRIKGKLEDPKEAWSEASYLVWNYNSTHYAARNMSTNMVEELGTNATTVLNAVKNAMKATGGMIFAKVGNYTVYSTFPDEPVLDITLKGEGINTKFIPSGSFDAIDIDKIQVVDLVWYDSSNVAHDTSITSSLQYLTGLFPRAFATNAAAQTRINLQRGYYYNGVTYIAYQGQPDLNPYVIAYNHTAGKWLEPVQVGTNPLSADMHGTPALTVDDQGYIHVAYGSHASAQKYAVSTNPEDISSWTQKSDFSITYPTYPMFIKITNGDLYLFYRSYQSGGDYDTVRYIKSTDNGATWSSEREIISFGSGYDIYLNGIDYDSTNNRIHFSWLRKVASPEQRQNVYHAYLNIATDTMYSMDGTNLGSTINLTEGDTNCKVYDSGSNWTWMPVVRVSSSGSVGIFFNEGGKPAPWTLKFTKWTGTAWSSLTTILGTNYSRGYPDWRWTSTSKIELYMVTDAGNSEPMYNGWGGDISLVVSEDSGNSFYLKRFVLTARQVGYPLIGAFTIENANSDLKIVAGHGYATMFGATLRWRFNFNLFAWGDNGFV